jgi:hypothetical protein
MDFLLQTGVAKDLAMNEVRHSYVIDYKEEEPEPQAFFSL